MIAGVETARTFIYGLGLIGMRASTGSPVFLHRDGLGSVTDITSATGTPLAWTEYQPFGAVRTTGSATGAPAVPFAYAGQYRDPTGLYDMRARAYDPTTGRFLSVDPLPPVVGTPCTSSCVYASNNPTLLTDPSGLCVNFIPAGALTGALAGSVEPGGGTLAGAAGGASVGFLAFLACTAAVLLGVDILASNGPAQLTNRPPFPNLLPTNPHTGDQVPLGGRPGGGRGMW